MYGDPALPPDFVSLPYANPDAPKGGRIIFGESGSFDSLNPFIIKGVRAHRPCGPDGRDALMARSYDEPFTLYGLLAESVETDDARSWVEFTLREGARFSDGSPVTSMTFCGLLKPSAPRATPAMPNAWTKIAKAEITGPRSVKFTFNTADRELPLILGLRPILKKAQWEGKDFTASTLEAPIGSGPYTVGAFESGRVDFIYQTQPRLVGQGSAVQPRHARILMRSAMNFSVMTAWCSRRSKQARSPATAKQTPPNG